MGPECWCVALDPSMPTCCKYCKIVTFLKTTSSSSDQWPVKACWYAANIAGFGDLLQILQDCNFPKDHDHKFWHGQLRHADMLPILQDLATCCKHCKIVNFLKTTSTSSDRWSAICCKYCRISRWNFAFHQNIEFSSPVESNVLASTVFDYRDSTTCSSPSHYLCWFHLQMVQTEHASSQGAELCLSQRCHRSQWISHRPVQLATRMEIILDSTRVWTNIYEVIHFSHNLCENIAKKCWDVNTWVVKKTGITIKGGWTSGIMRRDGWTTNSRKWTFSDQLLCWSRGTTTE